MDVVRVADLEDVRPAWLALAADMLERDGDLARPRTDVWEHRRGQYERWLADPDAALLAAREDGQVVGYAALRTMDPWTWRETPGRAAELETLSVLPHARGRGVGSALWDACRRHLREHGITDALVGVMESNVRARAFYARAGFQAFTSTWWLSPPPRDGVPDGVEPVPHDEIDTLRPLHLALRERHLSVEPDHLPPMRSADEQWALEREELREGVLLRAGPDAFIHATFEDPWAVLDTGRIGHVETLSVGPGARGKGLGATLLRAAGHELAERGARVLTLATLEGNHDADRFYEREGWRRVARTLYASVG